MVLWYYGIRLMVLGLWYYTTYIYLYLYLIFYTIIILLYYYFHFIYNKYPIKYRLNNAYIIYVEKVV